MSNVSGSLTPELQAVLDSARLEASKKCQPSQRQYDSLVNVALVQGYCDYRVRDVLTRRADGRGATVNIRHDVNGVTLTGSLGDEGKGDTTLVAHHASSIKDMFIALNSQHRKMNRDDLLIDVRLAMGDIDLLKQEHLRSKKGTQQSNSAVLNH